MADEASRAGTSSYQVTGESPESTIEINIKTLDSKIYTLRVNKDMPVPTLKEKLVDVAGVPVERQRLIFRGKVLKDDHLLSEYYLEDGDTLHLVARQPVEGQSSSGTGLVGAAHDSSNQGNDPTADAPRNRVAQVSHSVLLGTVNVADQGENIVADIGQLVGAVLSSLGIGTSSPSGSASDTPSATASNQTASSAEAERNQNTSDTPVSNTSSQGFAINNLFQSLHQGPRFSPTGFPSHHMTIPDSLTTLSQFITRMELMLQNGGSGSSSSPNNQHDPLNPESSSLSTRGLPTPEMLRMIMQQAQQLLSGNAAAALSRVAERLEREGTSTDTTVRGQIQAEAMNVGAAMQHLGAMLLELGRTIMTLRMGQSPTDSVVNAGPAVYISSAGPNPIMVQPFPLQANSLFGVPPSPFLSGISGPIPTRDPSRNVNIHIHAGSPFIPGVSSAAARASSGETVHGEHTNAQQANTNGNGTGNSVPTQGLPSRTVVAAIPARPNAQTSGHVLSVVYPVHVRSQQSVPVPSASAQVSSSTVSSGPQPPAIAVPRPSSQPGTVPTIIEQLSAHVASALAGRLGSLSQSVQSTQSTNAQGSQAQAGLATQVDQTPPEANALPGNAQAHSSSPIMQSTDSSCIGGPEQALPDSLSSHLAQDDMRGHAGNVDIGDRESFAAVIPNDLGVSVPRSGGEKLSQESSNDFNNLEEHGSSGIDVNSSATTSTGGLPVNQKGGQISNDRSYENNSDSAATDHTPQSGKGGDSDKPVPLGLLGGLQSKRRGKTAKPVGKNQVSCETPSINQDQLSIARGQQFLHSLVSQSSDVDRANMNNQANPQTSVVGQNVDGLPLQRQGTNGEGQVNSVDMISHVLQTPAFSSLLTGVAEQTGIGSSDDLRSMLEQCTQSPAIRNTLNDFAEQVERQPESIGALFSGRGQGGLDFSRMMQQMLPVVSQALGRGSAHSPPASGLHLNSQTQSDDGRSTVEDMLHEGNTLGDLEHAVERIQQHDSPVNVFRSVLESAGHLFGEGNNFDDLINTLVSNGELTSYWFCEHIDVIEPRESMEKETPRAVRWILHDLNCFLDNHDLASIEQANVYERMKNITKEENFFLSLKIVEVEQEQKQQVEKINEQEVLHEEKLLCLTTGPANPVLEELQERSNDDLLKENEYLKRRVQELEEELNVMKEKEVERLKNKAKKMKEKEAERLKKKEKKIKQREHKEGERKKMEENLKRQSEDEDDMKKKEEELKKAEEEKEGERKKMVENKNKLSDEEDDKKNKEEELKKAEEEKEGERKEMVENKNKLSDEEDDKKNKEEELKKAEEEKEGERKEMEENKKKQSEEDDTKKKEDELNKAEKEKKEFKITVEVPGGDFSLNDDFSLNLTEAIAEIRNDQASESEVAKTLIHQASKPHEDEASNPEGEKKMMIDEPQPHEEEEPEHEAAKMMIDEAEASKTKENKVGNEDDDPLIVKRLTKVVSKSNIQTGKVKPKNKKQIRAPAKRDREGSDDKKHNFKKTKLAVKIQQSPIVADDYEPAHNIKRTQLPDPSTSKLYKALEPAKQIVIKDFFDNEDISDPAYINHDEDIQIHGKLVEEILFDKYIDRNVIDFYSIHLHQRGIIEKKISIYFRTAAWQGASLDNPSLIEHFIRKKLRLWDDNIQYMFFSICHSITPGKSGDHWTVLSFNAQTHEWTFYNSLLPTKGSVARIKGKYMTDAQLMKEKILRVMEEEIKSGNIKIKGTLQKKQYIHVSQCTQQTNGYDCAVFVCKYMECIALGTSKVSQINVEDIRKFRAELAYMIISDPVWGYNKEQNQVKNDGIRIDFMIMIQEFMGMLSRDLHRRTQTDSGH